MTDDDLAVECVCGCTRIVKRDGYNTSTLSDAAHLGQVAGNLCANPRRYPWVNVRRMVFYWVMILLIVPLSYWMAGENERHEMTSLLQRAHGRYMRMDMDGARKDVLAVLKMDDSNSDARDCLTAIYGVGSSDHE